MSTTLIGTLVDEPVRIPEGEYTVQFVTFHTSYYRGNRKSAKLRVECRVQDGKYQGTRLYRYYNVLSISDAPRERGEFGFGYKSDLFREYLDLFGDQADIKAIDWSLFENNKLTAQVKTVKQSHSKEALNRYCQYSIIRSLSKRADLPF